MAAWAPRHSQVVSRAGLEISGLVEGATYAVRVVTQLDGVDQSIGPVAFQRVAETPFAAPELTVVPSRRTHGGIEISWVDVDGAVRYDVQWRVKAAAGDEPPEWAAPQGGIGLAPYAQQPGPLSLSSDVANLVLQVRIRGYSDFNAGTWSPAVEVVTPVIRPLPAPLNLVATPSGTVTGRIDVAWSPVAGAVDYTLAHRIGQGTWTEVPLTTTAYAFTGTAGVTYTFRVNAAEADGGRRSDWSEETEATARDVAVRALGVPANLRAATGTAAGQVRLRWDAVAGAAGYEVRANPDPRPAGASVFDVETGTAYTFQGQAGWPYYFWVRAYASGKTVYSDWSGVVARRAAGTEAGPSEPREPERPPTPPPPPVAPPPPTPTTPTEPPLPATAITAAADTSVHGRVHVNWNAVAGAQRYRLAYLTGGASSWSYTTLSGTGRTFDGLEGATWHFQVRAERNDGTRAAAWSNTASATTTRPRRQPLPSLPAPQNLRITARINRDSGRVPPGASASDYFDLTLTWDEVDDALSYVVAIRRVGGSSQWSEYAVTANEYSRFWRFQQTYAEYWRVKAIGAQGIESAWSDQLFLRVADDSGGSSLGPQGGGGLKFEGYSATQHSPGFTIFTPSPGVINSF